MMFSFVAKHRGIWPVALICEALTAEIRKSFLDSDRTYGARRVWHDVLAAGLCCGLHAIERLMRLNALKARPRRRRLPADSGARPATELADDVRDAAYR
jgi:putative transposase